MERVDCTLEKFWSLPSSHEGKELHVTEGKNLIVVTATDCNVKADTVGWGGKLVSCAVEAKEIFGVKAENCSFHINGELTIRDSYLSGHVTFTGSGKLSLINVTFEDHKLFNVSGAQVELGHCTAYEKTSWYKPDARLEPTTSWSWDA